MRARTLRVLLPVFLLGCAHCQSTDELPAPAETAVTLLHFSDYHSHAVPFFSEHRPRQAGLGRTVAYLRGVRASAEHALVLSGGDMLNAGVPAWSDKYGCAEWPWLSGLLDVMAFGNHDVDYGWDAFSACRKGAPFPILSGNLVGADGKPILQAEGRPYVVKDLGAVRVGIFALSGPDFGKLVKPANLPAGARFTDPIEAARGIVAALRGAEAVDAVVFIGHQDWESDFAMAKAVPGIDLILGTHSHYKHDLTQIPGTSTYFISPYQYLTYLSQVELRFRGNKLAAVSGKLVKMDDGAAEDPETAGRTARMQAELEADPKFADRFQVIGQAAVELSSDDIDRGESVLGNFAMDALRGAAQSAAALSTASSFRASIPPGAIRREDYLTAIPYSNKVLTFQLTGAQLQRLLSYSLSKRGSDNFAVTSGLRYVIRDGQATQVQVAKNAPQPMPDLNQYEPLDEARSYTVMTTNYMADIAAGYSPVFQEAMASRKDTTLTVTDTLVGFIEKNSPVSGRVEGRITEAK